MSQTPAIPLSAITPCATDHEGLCRLYWRKLRSLVFYKKTLFLLFIGMIISFKLYQISHLPSQAEAMKVMTGMTRAEVASLLGDPAEMEKLRPIFNRELGVERWEYRVLESKLWQGSEPFDIYYDAQGRVTQIIHHGWFH